VAGGLDDSSEYVKIETKEMLAAERPGCVPHAERGNETSAEQLNAIELGCGDLKDDAQAIVDTYL
jgi:hypothetical protein